MADNKITQTNGRFLYETAAAATPTTWTPIDEGYTWSDSGRLFRVTADEGQFDTTAYIAQRTNESGNYEDAITIKLNLPDGHGLSRIDVYSSVTVTGSPDYTLLTKTASFGFKGELDLMALDQQMSLEGDMGVVFDYAGTKYRGVITSRDDNKDQEAGGFLEGHDASIMTSRKQWSDASVVPILGASITAGNIIYRILRIIKNNAHFQILLQKHKTQRVSAASLDFSEATNSQYLAIGGI